MQEAPSPMTLPQLRRGLRAWFGSRAMARVFDPLLADWAREADRAVHALPRAITHARWAAALMSSGLRVWITTRSGTDAARRVVRHTTVLVAVLTLWTLFGGRGESLARLLTGTLAQMALVAPVIAIYATRRERRFARAWRAGLTIAIAAVFVQAGLTLLAWLVGAPPPPAAAGLPPMGVRPWPLHAVLAVLTLSTSAGAVSIFRRGRRGRLDLATSLLGLSPIVTIVSVLTVKSLSPAGGRETSAELIALAVAAALLPLLLAERWRRRRGPHHVHVASPDLSHTDTEA